MSSGTKSISKSVSLEPELWERIENKSLNKFGGNRSAYIREQVLADLDQRFSPVSEDTLIELARIFHPTIEKALRSHLRGNQGRIVARFLESLAEALLRDDFDPEAHFALYNSGDQMTALMAVKPGGPEFIQKLRELTFSDLKVAEKQEPYTALAHPKKTLEEDPKRKPRK